MWQPEQVTDLTLSRLCNVLLPHQISVGALVLGACWTGAVTRRCPVASARLSVAVTAGAAGHGAQCRRCALSKAQVSHSHIYSITPGLYRNRNVGFHGSFQDAISLILKCYSWQSTVLMFNIVTLTWMCLTLHCLSTFDECIGCLILAKQTKLIPLCLKEEGTAY